MSASQVLQMGNDVVQHTIHNWLRPAEDVSILLKNILADKIYLLSLPRVCPVVPASKNDEL